MNTMRKITPLLLAAAFAASPVVSLAQAAPVPPTPKEEDASRLLEFKANDMLNKGLELLEARQDERAIKMITSVPQQFPKSKARLKAHLALGKHYASRGSHELALKQFEHLNESDVPDEQAEGLYQAGICQYNLGAY